MSTVKTKNVQVGTDGTASNNFTIYVPGTPDGTVRIGNGDAGAVTDAVTINSSGAVTLANNLSVTGTSTLTGNVSVNGANISTQPSFRNRIINGDMRIDQRSAGASVTITGDGQYPSVDRFIARTFGGSGRFSMQQVSDAPAGFTNSLKVTVTTTDTSGTAGYSIDQRIEGLNITDFNFGSVNAKTYTVSFWVKASIAGTYTLANRTSSATASCVNTYTINSANTWEKKIITFPANTAYTTSTDNTVSIYCDFGFGAQTSKSTSTLGVWQAGNYVFNSSQVDLMQTSGATFYITGVQLEAGTTATDFEFLPYDVQLARCFRYYEYQGLVVYSHLWNGSNTIANIFFSVPKRAAPTLTQDTGSIPAPSLFGGTTYFPYSGCYVYWTGSTAPNSSNWIADAEL